MTGPIHLSAAWALVIAVVVLIVWLSWKLRKQLLEAENEPWPRRDEGGAYWHQDGRITRDRAGEEIVSWWKSPDPGAEQ